MRKITFKALPFLFCFIIAVLFPVTVKADESGIKSGDWEYVITDDGNAAVIGYYGAETDITVPDNIDGYQVTEIRQNLTGSSNIKSVRSIIIPDGVTSIDEFTFYCAFNLERVVIPDSVTSIVKA